LGLRFQLCFWPVFGFRLSLYIQPQKDGYSCRARPLRSGRTFAGPREEDRQTPDWELSRQSSADGAPFQAVPSPLRNRFPRDRHFTDRRAAPPGEIAMHPLRPSFWRAF